MKKTKLNVSSSLLFINLLNYLLKLTDFSKQDFSKCSLHRTIIFGKSVRFILFFYNLEIFPFPGNLKKVNFCPLCYGIYKLHQETILRCVFNRISNNVLLQESCSSSELLL